MVVLICVPCRYREQGVFVWRGFTAQEMADQCFGNKDAAGLGPRGPGVDLQCVKALLLMGHF